MFNYSSSAPNDRSPLESALTPSSSPYSRRKRQLYPRRVASYEVLDHQPTSPDTPAETVLEGQNGGCAGAVEPDVEYIGNDEYLIERNTVDVTLPVELSRPNSRRSRWRFPQNYGSRSRIPRRSVTKHGVRNVEVINVPRRWHRYLKDIVTTLIDEQWRYTLLVFSLSFFFLWTLFALLWWLVATAHGDLSYSSKGERLNDGKQCCVEGAETFTGFFLLSVETQASIGFGSRYPNEECPEGVFLMVMQIVMGYAIQGAMVGILYAKMVRPAKRTEDMLFSKVAVVCQRDGLLCLMFRLCDPLKQHIVGTDIRAYWIETHVSAEGEKLRHYQSNLNLESNGRLLLLWPVTAVHVIDEFSPLYDLSAKDLLEKRFELVVTLTGSSCSTGQVTQARTSYLPKEILWGHRFKPLLRFDDEKGSYIVERELLNSTYQINTPLCSASRLLEVIEEVRAHVAEEHVDNYHNANATTSYSSPTYNTDSDFQTTLTSSVSPTDDNLEAADMRQYGDDGVLHSAVHHFRSQMNRLVSKAENYISSSSDSDSGAAANRQMQRGTVVRHGLKHTAL